jgi:hypothetical protein
VSCLLFGAYGKEHVPSSRRENARRSLLTCHPICQPLADCAAGFGSTLDAFSFPETAPPPAALPPACQPPNAPRLRGWTLPPCSCSACPQGTASQGGALGSREASCSRP